LIIGAMEILNLIGTRFALTGDFWRWIAHIDDHFGTIGCGIILGLLGCWAFSFLLFRMAGDSAGDSSSCDKRMLSRWFRLLGR